ncbi:tetratricopeptide repeat protein [Thiovibrio sp. JS02]
MQRYLLKSGFLVLALTAALAGGCASGPTRVARPEVTPVVTGQGEDGGREASAGAGVGVGGEIPAQEHAFSGDALASLRAHVAGRYALYQAKAKQWSELEEGMLAMNIPEERPAGWAECRGRLDALLASYGRLAGGPGGGALDFQLLAATTAADMEYLVGGCQAVYMSGKEGVEHWQGVFGQRAAEEMEKTIIDAVGGARYDEAIGAYRGLGALYPQHPPAPEVIEQIAIALLHKGQLVEALQVLQDTLGREKPRDLTGLKMLYADLLLVGGRTGEARRLYGELARYYGGQQGDRRWVDEQLVLLAAGAASGEQMRLYAGLLRDYLLFDGRQVPAEMQDTLTLLERTAPGSPVLARARQLVALAQARAGTWTGTQLASVEALIAENKFSEAAALLDALLREDLAPEARQHVEEIRARVKGAENQDTATLNSDQGETLLGQWERAMNLLGLRRYDEAIEAFSALAGTDYEEKARAKMAEAVNLAANEMRHRAAALFVKAKKSKDVGGQRQLMLESRALLLEIVRKYPDSEILDKVRLNLKSIAEQIPGGMDNAGDLVAPPPPGTENARGGAGSWQ